MLLIANVFAPGAGTLAAAYITHRRLRSATTYVGVAQLCTIGLLGLGWLWAIAWGVLLWRKARDTSLADIVWRVKRERRWVWIRKWVPVGGPARKDSSTPRVAKVALQ